MRLIDAEALQDDGANYVWSRFADCSLIKREIRFVNREQIDNAPTVEAIPIDWIKKYGVKKNEMVYTALENVLYWLIKDWEKENADTE